MIVRPNFRLLPLLKTPCLAASVFSCREGKLAPPIIPASPPRRGEGMVGGASLPTLQDDKTCPSATFSAEHPGHSTFPNYLASTLQDREEFGIPSAKIDSGPPKRAGGFLLKYEKCQATHEFTRWSESYDRSILQWLLFSPSHRAIAQSDSPAVPRPADPRPGRGVRDRGLRGEDPRGLAEGAGLGDRPGLGDARQGPRALESPCRRAASGARGQRTPAVRRRDVRRPDVREQLPPLPEPGAGRGRVPARA